MRDFIILLTIAPTAIILWYINNKDPHKEPEKILSKSFTISFLVTFLIGFVEGILNHFFPVSLEMVGSYFELFIRIMIIIALVEELSKWFVTKKLNYDKNHFDETFDAIVYAVVASLGFATCENLGYVLSSGIGSSLIVAILRLFTAVPSQAVDGIFMGYFISKARLSKDEVDTKSEKIYLALSIIVPVVLHTIYDFIALAGFDYNIIMLIIFIGVTDIIAIKLVNKASIENRPYKSIANSTNKI